MQLGGARRGGVEQGLPRRERRCWRLGALTVCALAQHGWSQAQSLEVSIRVEVLQSGQAVRHRPLQRSEPKQAPIEAVVWLSPLATESLHASPAQRTYALTQKNKQFTPHLLVVPTGSSVDFPNDDPFFHNVFSLYNGKRFDLGLYEAHTHRAVRFDREGISYIFCNIHPQMGAVVLALSTPFYAMAQPTGKVTLHSVPRGSYRLHVWAENVPVDQLAGLERTVEVAPGHADLGVLTLQTGGDMMEHHENKFGQEYTPDTAEKY